MRGGGGGGSCTYVILNFCVGEKLELNLKYFEVKDKCLKEVGGGGGGQKSLKKVSATPVKLQRQVLVTL